MNDEHINGSGDYKVDLISFNPYLSWTAGKLDLWATAGYGQGELEIILLFATAALNTVEMSTLAMGGSRAVLDSAMRLKGEVLQAKRGIGLLLFVLCLLLWHNNSAISLNCCGRAFRYHVGLNNAVFGYQQIDGA